MEKEYILAALDVNEGNQTHTGRAAKIGSATLYRKLKRYGLIPGRRGGTKDVVEPEPEASSS